MTTTYMEVPVIEEEWYEHCELLELERGDLSDVDLAKKWQLDNMIHPTIDVNGDLCESITLFDLQVAIFVHMVRDALAQDLCSIGKERVISAEPVEYYDGVPRRLLFKFTEKE